MALLSVSYARRKRFEAQLIAIEVGRMLSGTAGAASAPDASNAQGGMASHASQAGQTGGHAITTRRGRRAQVVSPMQMLNMMGMKIE